MASERKRATPAKRAKVTVDTPEPGEPDHPCVKRMERATAAIRRQHEAILHVATLLQELSLHSYDRDAALAESTRESREGMVQVRGELEQVRTHLARFIDAGIRERGRDERIEAQLAGINERLKERSRDGRVVRHGKAITAEELSRQLDATERAKDEEIATLICEVDRLRSELEAARKTVATLEGMAVDPQDHGRRMPPPRKSWRTAVAEGVAAAPLD